MVIFYLIPVILTIISGQICHFFHVSYIGKTTEMLYNLNIIRFLLQAEFQNVIDSISKFGKCSCLSASIAWNPSKGETQQSSFVLGFNSDIPQLNSSKVCEPLHS